MFVKRGECGFILFFMNMEIATNFEAVKLGQHIFAKSINT